MTRYPLLFMFRDRLDVRGDLVEVTVRGRALAEQEPEGWWLYGVNPGDLAESGGTSTEAYAAFRKAFSEVLQDIAVSVKDLHAFKAEVHEFFTPNVVRQAQWDSAVKDVKAGRVTAELTRLPADSPRGVDVKVIGKAPQPMALDPQQMELAA